MAKPPPIKGYTARMGRGGIPIYTRIVPKPPKKTGGRTVTRPSSTPAIETPAQIEARVRKMAEEAFNRERNAVREEADRLKQQAEGRRRGMAAAYEAAARSNAGMGADVQQGWEQAAGTIQGLANTTTGGIADALAADLATQEQALARVGAAGTGFDARSQAAVEAYRGGRLPAEYFTRLGGVGRQFLNESGVALSTRGLQEGLAEEATRVGEIDTDVISQIKALTQSRTEYESALREQLLGARNAQVAAAQKAKADAAKLKYDYWKQTTYLNQKQAELDASYREARLKAQTAAEKLAVDKWYKQNKLMIDQARAAAYQANVGSMIEDRATDTDTDSAAIPNSWQAAWSQYGDRLDDVLDGKDPRFFVKDEASGQYTLKQKYMGPNGAKALQTDLLRLIGRPYLTKFGKKRQKDLAARAYAKAYAVFRLYKGEVGAAAPSTGAPSTGTGILVPPPE